MRRICIISDIHGNMTALQEVFNSISRLDVQNIICLGDIVGKGPLPSESIDLCREKCSIIIKGNWDDYLIHHDGTNDEIRWQCDQLSADQLDYLRNLPETHTFVFGNRTIRLFHASSKGIHHRVHMHESLENHSLMFDNTDFTGYNMNPDVVGYGDIHAAYIKYYDNKILFNAGSVGNPLDINQASYILLEENEWPNGQKTLDFSFKRVVYDLSIEIDIAIKKKMPKLEEYKNELLTAKKYRRKKD